MEAALRYLVFIISLCAIIESYPYGPPQTDYICEEMFPVGHGVDAQFTQPPYEIQLTKNIYSQGYEKFRVTIKALHGYYIGGLFIQARRASNCGTKEQKKPVGYFSLLPGDHYLKVLSCNDRLNSSLSHRINRTLKHAVFYWHAPGTQIGHIYLVATVVKDRTTFWTRVYSEIIRDVDSSAQAEVCSSRVLLDPEGNHTNKYPWWTTQQPQVGEAKCGGTRFDTDIIFVTILAIAMRLAVNVVT